VWQQLVEQLECVVEAEASRAGAAGDEALQHGAPVPGGARAAGHVHGVPVRLLAVWPGDEMDEPPAAPPASASGSARGLDRWGRGRAACAAPWSG
jgi:hypothetical protein